MKKLLGEGGPDMQSRWAWIVLLWEDKANGGSVVKVAGWFVTTHHRIRSCVCLVSHSRDHASRCHAHNSFCLACVYSLSVDVVMVDAADA